VVLHITPDREGGRSATLAFVVAAALQRGDIEAAPTIEVTSSSARDDELLVTGAIAGAAIIPMFFPHGYDPRETE
jgi:hypothetical protein